MAITPEGARAANMLTYLVSRMRGTVQTLGVAQNFATLPEALWSEEDRSQLFVAIKVLRRDLGMTADELDERGALPGVARRVAEAADAGDRLLALWRASRPKKRRYGWLIAAGLGVVGTVVIASRRT